MADGKIDPSLLFDEDGTIYYDRHEGMGDGFIGQAKINVQTGKLDGNLKEVWRGTGGVWPEGPHHALRWEDRPQFRTSMQCRRHRGNGETFLADVWFSSYKDGAKPKLAAIIADVSEEQAHPPAASSPNSVAADQQERAALSNRELDALRLVVQGLANKEIASRMEISESAVKNTLQQLFAKTEVRTRGQLVRVALERYRDLL